jgi:hypothetical protein
VPVFCRVGWVVWCLWSYCLLPWWSALILFPLVSWLGSLLIFGGVIDSSDQYNQAVQLSGIVHHLNRRSHANYKPGPSQPQPTRNWTRGYIGLVVDFRSWSRVVLSTPSRCSGSRQRARGGQKNGPNQRLVTVSLPKMCQKGEGSSRGRR